MDVVHSSLFLLYVLSQSHQNLTYFTTLNPLMNNSGAFEVSKWSYLSKFPENWISKTFKANKETSKRELHQLIQSHPNRNKSVLFRARQRGAYTKFDR